MRKFNKFIALFVAVFLMISTCAISAFAATPSVEELQRSVVYIECSVELKAANISNMDLSIVSYGTGFAVGEKGKPIQHIATCNHCVSMPSGVYSIAFDRDGNYIGYFEETAGTKYPQKIETDNYIIFIDYYECELVELKAVFSAASNDYSTMSVINTDPESDVAICKLSSDATDKIIARPFKTRENVSVGDSVYAIGFPASSELFNSQKTHDYTDTTVTKGIISKTLLTYGTTSTTKQFYAHQIDAQITHGNSGGPLFSEDGYIIGINAFGNDDEKSTKANYAIASDELLKLLDASDVPYDLAPEVNVGLIVALVAAVAIIAAVVVVILVLNNKKKGKVPAVNNASAPVMNATVAMGNNPAPAPAPVPAPASPVSGKYYLLGIKGVFEGKKYSIDERVIIGRNREKCNVVYADNQPGVSGIHCEIIRSGSVLTLKDCGSTYGTYLGNGTKVAPNLPVVLKSGERFWVGDKENVFEVRY